MQKKKTPSNNNTRNKHVITKTGPMLIQELQCNSDRTTCLALSRDGSLIASSGTNANPTVEIWHTDSGNLMFTLQGHDMHTSCLQFSHNGSWLMGGGMRGSERWLVVWEMRGDRPPELMPEMARRLPTGLREFKMSPNGKKIACVSVGESVAVFGFLRDEPLRDLTGEVCEVGCLAWSHDSAHVACGGCDKLLHVLDADTGKHAMEPLRGHDHDIQCVAFNSDSSCLASASADKVIIIWELVQGGTATVKHRLESARLSLGSSCLLPGHAYASTCACGSFVAFSPDGAVVVSGVCADKTVLVWDLGSGHLVKAVEGLSRGDVAGVVWANNGKDVKYVVSGGKAVCVWRVDTEVRVGQGAGGLCMHVCMHIAMFMHACMYGHMFVCIYEHAPAYHVYFDCQHYVCRYICVWCISMHVRTCIGRRTR
jgi:WD40 repeat protein